MSYVIYHTWYARTYGVNQYHTDRINKIINICNLENNHNKIYCLKDRVFNLKVDFNKIKNKFIIRFKFLFK